MSMRAEVVCGIDVGTTNVKVVAVDGAGSVVHRVARPTPRLPDVGAVDPDGLFTTLEQMLIEVAGADFAVRAVSTAGIGEDGVLVDEHQKPLCRALPWSDPERVPWLAKLQPVLTDVPGLPVATDAARTLVGWAWARQQPGTEAATRWMSLTDLAASRWTGRAFISDTLAARTGAWVTRDGGTWVGPRVSATLGDIALLPPVMRAGTVLGGLESKVLDAKGVLTAEAVVVAGGHDHPIGGWAVHRMRPGAVLDSMGTAEVVVAQSPQPDIPHSGVIDVAPGIRGPGSSLLAVQELARNIEWAAEDPDVAVEVRHLLKGTKTPNEFVTSDVFVPGVPGGGVPTYAPGTPRDPLSRASAVLGRLARLGADCVDAVAAHVPGDVTVYLAGGWTRSPGWLAMKSAAAGRELQVLPEPEVTAVGAALLAAEAIGWMIPAKRALSGQRAQPKRA